ncbi:MAG TPA: hypothetical protein VHE35_35355 [Kofleriaceae bacterium]|nr:hypothetical protein [Kofleriaceae bacterium]
MLTHSYSYQATLADSLKIGWQVEDLIGPDKRLDFSRPFLPESLAGVAGLTMLSDRERLLLNQIRGNSYLYLFGFVEEFILPFVIDEARAATPGGDPHEVRALIGFADEEAKHIHLFQRFAAEFAAGFGSPCGVVGPAADVAKVVLSHSRLGVAILTLHLEWMTQSHYLDSVKDDQDLDPQFKNLLRHHWMEEAQHAKLDTLVVDKLASAGGPDAIAKALADFGAIGGAVDGLLQQQTQLDLASLEAAAGRTLSADEREQIAKVQLRAYRHTFLVSGLVHKNFLNTVEQLSPGAAQAMLDMAQALSA